MIKHTPDCFSRHLGVVMCQPAAVTSTIALIKNNLFPMKSAEQFAADKANVSCPKYTVTDQIAIIKVQGMMQKAESKFEDFCSTVKIRASINAANNDPSVRGIMLFFDTPGGHSAGTFELAKTITESAKPIRAYICDSCFSAGYYAAAGCSHISINEPGFCGSIGTYMIIEDTSAAYEMNGVKAHLISSGQLKGMGADGVPVSDEALGAFGNIVASANSFFINSIQSGRKMSRESVEALATGAVWNSTEAKELNLVDAVESFDDALSNFSQSFAPTTKGVKMSENKSAQPDAAPEAVSSPADAALLAAAPAVTPEPQAADPGPELLQQIQAMNQELIQLKEENAQLKASQVIVNGAPPVPVSPVETQASQPKPMYKNGKLNR